jgi:hypothetical protein
MKKPPSQRPERQGQLLQVGKLYDPARRHWPEGADFNCRSGGHELRIFLRSAARAEVAAVGSGPVELGLFAEPEGLILVARFGPTLSFDCSYHWQRVAPEERTTPPPVEDVSPELRALLTVILVEATNGVVLALRAVRFSPEFTRSLHRAIADQVGAPYDPAGHQRWADGMTARHSTEQLWAKCTMRCQGGA